MQWLLTSHVRRYHKHYGSSGHVWQGRFKSFPVQRDEHLLMVLRYVLQNQLDRVAPQSVRPRNLTFHFY
jgi:putative transposase